MRAHDRNPNGSCSSRRGGSAGKHVFSLAYEEHDLVLNWLAWHFTCNIYLFFNSLPGDWHFFRIATNDKRYHYTSFLISIFFSLLIAGRSKSTNTNRSNNLLSVVCSYCADRPTNGIFEAEYVFCNSRFQFSRDEQILNTNLVCIQFWITVFGRRKTTLRNNQQSASGDEKLNCTHRASSSSRCCEIRSACQHRLELIKLRV